MHLNDHTDAEALRLEHAYELGREASLEDAAWDKWCNLVEAGLIHMGFTTEKQGLDGIRTRTDSRSTSLSTTSTTA